jgi:hypothetical protein
MICRRRNAKSGAVTDPTYEYHNVYEISSMHYTEFRYVTLIACVYF